MSDPVSNFVVGEEQPDEQHEVGIRIGLTSVGSVGSTNGMVSRLSSSSLWAFLEGDASLRSVTTVKGNINDSDEEEEELIDGCWCCWHCRGGGEGDEVGVNGTTAGLRVKSGEDGAVKGIGGRLSLLG